MTWLSLNWAVLLVLVGVVLFLMRRGGIGFGRDGHASHRGQALVDAPPVDPVSGETVARDSAVVTVYRGRVYYFASRENRDRFEAAQDKHAAQTR